eukprot:TRINITY_DN1790_c1_g3_i1.p2 TRINITY_DN1790_c1_g3~~TRINITY_DN1790_c1_g3_i1.p2  ORF type:complete len:189 (-),score=56.88 TRINITY_DN1790_c1_g3_i1:1346-1912(-)
MTTTVSLGGNLSPEKGGELGTTFFDNDNEKDDLGLEDRDVLGVIVGVGLGAEGRGGRGGESGLLMGEDSGDIKDSFRSVVVFFEIRGGLSSITFVFFPDDEEGDDNMDVDKNGAESLITPSSVLVGVYPCSFFSVTSDIIVSFCESDRTYEPISAIVGTDVTFDDLQLSTSSSPSSSSSSSDSWYIRG